MRKSWEPEGPRYACGCFCSRQHIFNGYCYSCLGWFQVLVKEAPGEKVRTA